AGYTLLRYEPRIIERKKYGMRLKEDVSSLTLQKKDQLIHLVLSKPRNEYWAEIEFEHDNQKFFVTKGKLIKIREQLYEVPEIDLKARQVTIRHMQSGDAIYIGARAKRPVAGAGE
ncbi:MAG: hypothetical protein AAF492_17555, partial [Verrucomicrobiota bacterium]